MKKEEIQIDSKVVYKGKILTVTLDDVKVGDIMTKREIVNHNGGVCVLSSFEGYIYFVRQYRYAYHDYILELPAGKIELGEDPYNSGIRELEEEVGLKAERLISMGKMYPSPGYTNEIIYLYKAENITLTKTNYDDDENIDIVKIKEDEVKTMLKNDEFIDSKTALLLYKYFYGND